MWATGKTMHSGLFGLALDLLLAILQQEL